MSKGGIELTEALIQTLKPRDKQYDVYDSKEKGLILSVNTSGSKSYRVIWARGKKITFAQYGELSLKEARAKAKEIIVAAKNGQLEKQNPKPKDITYFDFLETIYKDYLLSERKRGLETYKRLVSVFAMFGKTYLKDITFQDITKWKKKRLEAGILPNTVNRDMAAFKASLTYAVDYEYISKNPAKKIKRMTEVESDDRRCLTESEEPKFFNTLLTFPNDEFRVKTVMGWKAGARPIEVKYLVLSNIDLRRASSGVWFPACYTKVNKGRFTPIGRLCRVLLYLYLRKKFRPIGINIFKTYERIESEYKQRIFSMGSLSHGHRKPWAALMRRVSITNFTPYNLRHDYISKFLMKNGDIFTIAKLTGTSVTMIMKTYGKLIQKHTAAQVSVIDGRPTKPRIVEDITLAA